TGATNINQGAVRATVNGALGMGGAGGAPVLVADGGALEVAGGLAFDKSLTLNGNGDTGLGALRQTSAGTTTWTGPVTLETISIIGAAPADAVLAIDSGMTGFGGLTKDGAG